MVISVDSTEGLARPGRHSELTWCTGCSAGWMSTCRRSCRRSSIMCQVACPAASARAPPVVCRPVHMHPSRLHNKACIMHARVWSMRELPKCILAFSAAEVSEQTRHA